MNDHQARSRERVVTRDGRSDPSSQEAHRVPNASIARRLQADPTAA
jgi:hypothetical protein